MGRSTAPESEGPEAHGLNPTSPSWAEPSPSKTWATALTPGTEDCDFLWKSGTCRRSHVKMTWYQSRVSPDSRPVSSHGGGDTDVDAEGHGAAEPNTGVT